MADFKKNNCRLCPKVFCCQDCRQNHEIGVHLVFPNCALCVSVHQKIPNREESALLHHLIDTHGALNCIFCKEVFSCVYDLLGHKKCPLGFKPSNSPKSPFTPARPTGQATVKISCDVKVITSTPMQAESSDIIIENFEQFITPVDHFNFKEIPGLKSQSNESSLKRRVTFCNTPVIEMNRKTKQTSILKKQKTSRCEESLSNQSSMEEYLPYDRTISSKDESPFNTPGVCIKEENESGNSTDKEYDFDNLLILKNVEIKLEPLEEEKKENNCEIKKELNEEDESGNTMWFSAIDGQSNPPAVVMETKEKLQNSSFPVVLLEKIIIPCDDKQEESSISSSGTSASPSSISGDVSNWESEPEANLNCSPPNKPKIDDPVITSVEKILKSKMPSVSVKRSLSESEVKIPPKKRRVCDVKCRPPIKGAGSERYSSMLTSGSYTTPNISAESPSYSELYQKYKPQTCTSGELRQEYYSNIEIKSETYTSVGSQPSNRPSGMQSEADRSGDQLNIGAPAVHVCTGRAQSSNLSSLPRNVECGCGKVKILVDKATQTDPLVLFF